jgi:hypothetical protein
VIGFTLWHVPDRDQQLLSPVPYAACLDKLRRLKPSNSADLATSARA